MGESLTSLSFADRATQYARRVVSGEIPSCKWVRLCCQRHIDDLKRQGSEGFPFVYNPLMRNQVGNEYRPADRVCKFIELLPHVKGKWARQGLKIELTDWQVFVECSIFGWIHSETFLRRYKIAYIEVPRKNAKTTLAAGNALYLLMFDDEAGAEVYSAATSADQACISFNIAKSMVIKSPGMQKRFGVVPYSHSVNTPKTDGIFKYLSSDHKTLDGLNVHAGIMDEVHAMKTREVWDVIETATGSREQPLMIGITTAGSNRAGICYEQRTYTSKLLDGVAVDESYFGIIYTIDDDDDWTDPKTWAKANPNLGVSVFLDDLQRKCDKAKEMPAAQNNFKTKHLDVWVNADAAWMNMLKWDACAGDIDFNRYKGAETYVGLDLASRVDIAAMVRLWPVRLGDQLHCYIQGRYWLPRQTVENNKNSQYAGWAESGLLTVTPGDTIDFDYIEKDLLATDDEFSIKEIGYDPHQATQLSTRMIAQGLPMVEIRPSVLNFSEPMKELESMVLDGRIHHDGDPVLAWMISNVVAHYDKKDNIYPNKERPENKIDGVVALIMALGRCITAENKGPSVYETRGIINLNT